MYFRIIRASCHLLSADLKYSRASLLQVKSSVLGSVCHKSGGHQVQYKPYVTPCPEDHDHKNMKLKRPMSPHLTVYAPTVASMTSVAQRATGAILAFYALMMACGSLLLPHGVETYVSMIQSLRLGWLTVFIIKIILGAPFCFHYLNAMRYIAWNAGKLLHIKEVYSSAKNAAIGAVALTVLFALI